MWETLLIVDCNVYRVWSGPTHFDLKHCERRKMFSGLERWRDRRSNFQISYSVIGQLRPILKAHWLMKIAQSSLQRWAPSVPSSAEDLLMALVMTISTRRIGTCKNISVNKKNILVHKKYFSQQKIFQSPENILVPRKYFSHVKIFDKDVSFSKPTWRQVDW